MPDKQLDDASLRRLIEVGRTLVSQLDLETVIVLATWAAIAIANARSVAADRLRRTMEASERERRFWARKLHDETLQGLRALRLLLGSALRRGTARAPNPELTAPGARSLDPRAPG